MPNDAKLGLVVGVGIVVAIAVVYFRADTPGATPNPEPAAAVQPAAPASSTKANTRVARARPTGRQHTVAEGETLFSLAEHYYGDKGRFGEIFQANRQLLKAPDELAPGTVLLIPEDTPAAPTVPLESRP